MKVQEAINKINKEPIYSIFIADDIIDGKVVAEHQDRSQNRWYSTAVRVYQVEDGFVGVYGLFQVFSESAYYKDFDIRCEAYEVFPKPSTYYSTSND